jgi:hypothetical protein
MNAVVGVARTTPMLGATGVVPPLPITRSTFAGLAPQLHGQFIGSQRRDGPCKHCDRLVEIAFLENVDAVERDNRARNTSTVNTHSERSREVKNIERHSNRGRLAVVTSELHRPKRYKCAGERGD